MDVKINELGTDIHSSWNFKDGDLGTITNDDNLVQATKNRLNTRLGSSEYFYSEYGSVLHRFHGWRKNETTLKFMEIALTDSLEQDPRYSNFKLNLELQPDKRVKISVHVVYDDDTELDMDFILNTDGTVEES